jgi:predicted nuclease of restriction endonuclease-like RecB superfamily
VIPLDYLRIVKRGREIRPAYLREAAAAEAVLKAAQAAKTLGEFRKAVEAMAGDKKLLGGLARLVEQLMEIEQVDNRLVARVRLEVFKASAAAGYALAEEDREKIFQTVAARLRISSEEVKKLFQKAYEESRAILKPPSITPAELVQRYNLALIQTLLFKSLYVKATIPNTPAVVKNLVRAVKGLRLMYIAEEKAGGDLEFHFDGPVSALRQTERYGTRLAKLIPYVIAADRWTIEAAVKLNERQYTFKESHDKAPQLPRKPIETEEFDSSVEQEFYRQVSRLCAVEREPEVVVVNGRVYIPDFKIGGLYVEIVGFWTPDYLRRKYEKLMKVGKPLLILVNEELAMATWKELLPNVVLFKGRPRLEDVFKYIKPYCRR